MLLRTQEVSLKPRPKRQHVHLALLSLPSLEILQFVWLICWTSLGFFLDFFLSPQHCARHNSPTCLRTQQTCYCKHDVKRWKLWCGNMILPLKSKPASTVNCQPESSFLLQTCETAVFAAQYMLNAATFEVAFAVSTSLLPTVHQNGWWWILHYQEIVGHQMS